MIEPKEFLGRLMAFAQANPHLAERAFASGAARLRSDATRADQFAAVQLQLYANRLDQLSAAHQVPDLDPEPFEIHSTEADLLGGGVATQYDALIADIAASKESPSGTPNDDLVAAAMQQRYHAATVQATEIAEDGTPIGMPTQVKLTPASVGPDTLLGNQALIQFGGANPGGAQGVFNTGSQNVASGEAQVIRWDGLEHETMLCTIAISRAPLGSGASYPASSGPGGTLSYRPFAHLFWGTSRASPHEAYVDVGRGIQLTVASAFLYVSVGMDAPGNPSGTTEVPGSMVVRAHLSFFGADRQQPITRTVYIDNHGIGIGNLTNILIPAFARSIIPGGLRTTDPNGQMTLDIKDEGGAVIDHIFMMLPNSQVASIPLANDAYSIDVTNSGAIPATERIIFGLSL